MQLCYFLFSDTVYHMVKLQWVPLIDGLDMLINSTLYRRLIKTFKFKSHISHALHHMSKINSDHFPAHHLKLRKAVIYRHKVFSVRQAKIIGIKSAHYSYYQSCTVAQAISLRTLTRGDWVRSQASPCEICGRRNGTEKSLSPSSAVMYCQYPSTNGPYLSSTTF